MSLADRTLKISLDMEEHKIIHDRYMKHKIPKWSLIRSEYDETEMEITFYSICGNCKEEI